MGQSEPPHQAVPSPTAVPRDSGGSPSGRSWAQSLPVWLAALWWGSLTTLGFFVVPMLFANLPTPAMAGNMAAKLFSVQTTVSTVCGLSILLTFGSKRPLVPENTAQSAMIFVVGGMLLALLVEFVVAPRIVARANMALWHGAGTALYVMQWLCAAVVLGKLVRQSRTG